MKTSKPTPYSGKLTLTVEVTVNTIEEFLVRDGIETDPESWTGDDLMALVARGYAHLEILDVDYYGGS